MPVPTPKYPKCLRTLRTLKIRPLTPLNEESAVPPYKYQLLEKDDGEKQILQTPTNKTASQSSPSLLGRHRFREHLKRRTLQTHLHCRFHTKE